jgi:hypothetical protein
LSRITGKNEVASLGPAAPTELIETTFDYRVRDTRPRQRRSSRASSRKQSRLHFRSSPSAVRIRRDLHPSLFPLPRSLDLKRKPRFCADEPRDSSLHPRSQSSAHVGRKRARENRPANRPHPLIRLLANPPPPRRSLADPHSPAEGPVKMKNSPGIAGFSQAYTHTHIYIYICVYIYFFLFFLFSRYRGTAFPAKNTVIGSAVSGKLSCVLLVKKIARHRTSRFPSRVRIALVIRAGNARHVSMTTHASLIDARFLRLLFTENFVV